MLKFNVCTKRYDELHCDDVILFHGGKLIITSVTRIHKNDDIIVYFTVKPFDNYTIEVLGNFYSNGTYGGNCDLTVKVLGRNI